MPKRRKSTKGEAMRNGEFTRKTIDSHQTDYIVEGLLGTNRLGIWASIPGEGKSLIAETLCYHVAYGALFLGMEVKAGNVMIIDSENRKDILVNRVNKIKEGLRLDGHSMQCEVDIQHYSGFLLDDRSTWHDIVSEIGVLKPSLIVIDHLAAFHHQDEDRENQMKKVTLAIETLISLTGSSVLVLHHFGKLDKGTFFKKLRGTSALYAVSDAACEVRTLSKTKDGRLEKIGLIPQARKEITPNPLRIKVEEGDGWLKLIYDGTYKPMEDPKMDMLLHKFYHLFLEDQTEKTVKQVMGTSAGFASDTELRDCLRFMEHNLGLITSERKGKGGGFHYSLCYPHSAQYIDCPWCNQRFPIKNSEKV
jgi:hypothetical protein